MTTTQEATQMPPDTSVTDADVRTVVSAARSRLRHARNSPHPRKRAEKAAVVAHDVQAQADAARHRRDQAATALQVIHGWEPVQVYNLIGVTRGLYARIRTRNVRRGIDADYRNARVAERVASENKGVPERLDTLAEQAREVRDQAVKDLLTGEGGDRWSNADVARLTKLTTARIAQLRPDANGKAA